MNKSLYIISPGAEVAAVARVGEVIIIISSTIYSISTIIGVIILISSIYCYYRSY